MDNRVNETARFDLPRPLAPTPQAEAVTAAVPAGAEADALTHLAEQAVSPAPLPPTQAPAGAAEPVSTVLPATAAAPASPATGPSLPVSATSRGAAHALAAPHARRSEGEGGWTTSATPTTAMPRPHFADHPAEAGRIQASVPPAASLQLTGQSARYLAAQAGAAAQAAPATQVGAAVPVPAHAHFAATAPVVGSQPPRLPIGTAMPDYGQQTGTNHLPGATHFSTSAGARPNGAGPASFPSVGARPGASDGVGLFPGDSYAQPAQAETRARRGPTWLGVTGIALACSLAASAGTFALMGGVQGTEQTGAGGVTTVAPLVDANGETPNWQAVQRAVGNSVVSIELEIPGGGSSGSGVVIDQAGHIVTNHHVVAGAIAGEVTVTLADGRIYTGKVVGSDSATDLAVVKLDNPPADLSVASLGSSENLQVGQAVAAIGNPLGYASTMTTGIISALDRPVWTEQNEATGDASSALTVTNAIQIDASINPGNSGGPLFDAGGRVIGINSSIATIKESSDGEAGSIGLGFAIPVDVAKLIADQIIESGTVKHAFLGVSLAEGTVELNGAGYTGAKVVEVTAGSSAQNAGVQAEDVIVSLNGKPVASVPALMAAIRAQPVGAQVKLAVVRGGEKIELDATLQARSETEN